MENDALAFVQVREATNGEPYGILAFDGEIPGQGEIDEIIGRYQADGVSDWNIHDVIVDLRGRGYAVDIVELTETDLFI